MAMYNEQARPAHGHRDYPADAGEFAGGGVHAALLGLKPAKWEFSTVPCPDGRAAGHRAAPAAGIILFELN